MEEGQSESASDEEEGSFSCSSSSVSAEEEDDDEEDILIASSAASSASLNLPAAQKAAEALERALAFAAALCLPLLAGCDGSAPASEASCANQSVSTQSQ